MTSEYRIPAPLQNTIDNLSFLASTQEGDKLFFKEKSHVKECEWMARARRYYYNENYFVYVDNNNNIINFFIIKKKRIISTFKFRR